MGEAADAGNAFGKHGRLAERQALEPLFHAAMLEEELRLEVQDVLADIEEGELDGFHHVSPHRAERQLLDIRILDFRKSALRRLETASACRQGSADRAEARPDAAPSCRTSRCGSGWPAKVHAEEVGDLALVPADQRADAGNALHRSIWLGPPDDQAAALGLVADVAKLEVAARSDTRRRPSASCRPP